MPELPEIETVKRQLSGVLIGRKIAHITAHHSKTLHGNPDHILNKKITSVNRRGKMLIIDLEKDMYIAIHFKMSGQLILVKSEKLQVKSDPSTGSTSSGFKEVFKNRIVGGHPTEDWISPLPSKHTRVTFELDDGSMLYFNDQRLFGWVKILTTKELEALPFLKKLGPEIWSITPQEFFESIHKKKKSIKVAIMDQSILSGVGNIYANDALWDAKINPKTLCSQLTLDQATVLHGSLIKILDEGVTYGGATAADNKYIDLHGLGGTYQEHFRTYDRTGLPCLRCKTLIEKFELGGRGTYVCPVCQKI